ncbi:hypothetical protein [Bosea sp. BK604]|uniref:hypothetical protein n=1 Tax=Bosea sp. BK604 TaxID=2512180 RepID=UPI00105139DB|nr:hypothetical protein [Bosea sp. BK604]TCR69899.1 hypothetical protein EV560_101298 [Bosea sp. BK604]
MKTVAASILLATSFCAGEAFAGNTSSNSSSNSSNGIHTRVDTIISDDGRGRRSYYERRIYRDERGPRERRRYRSW